MRPLIYTTRLNVAADFRDELRAWFRDRHAPDLMGAGFFSAHAFDSDSALKTLNVYEIPSLAIFGTEAYQAPRRTDTVGHRARDKIADMTASIFTQLAVWSRGGWQEEDLPLVMPNIVVARFDTAAPVAEWVRRSLPDWAAAHSTIHAVRLLEQQQRHPALASHEPRFAILAELAAAADGAALAGDLADFLGAAGAPSFQSLSIERAERLHSTAG